MSGERELRLQFASDNYAGICPEAMAGIREANEGHSPSYGTDRWTEEACDLFRELFGVPCEVFFVLNGTAANALALASLCHSYHSIIAHRHAHVETDECGAPEFFSHGAKILLAEGKDGRMDPAGIEELVTRRADIHYPKPRAVSVTQATEMGTVYDVADLGGIREEASRHALKFHMDGARFANAVASLGVAPRALTVDCGVDVLCFGGSKNGLGLGEAVIFFDPELAREFDYRCKQAGQLASKMRFLAAQWIGSLRGGGWLRHAAHANACARELERRLAEIPGIEIMFPVQANSVFVKLQPRVIDALRANGWVFYTFIGLGGARLMCSWDTREEAIVALVADIKRASRA
ncbi:MAG TPA: low specificity L-threonine aldolase [Verrucomicrobiae bacterium]|nr:low specificity L-threonine aldolase [Verrucomicrobiae bacterium]